MSSPITRKQAALKSMARRKSTSMPPERPPVDLAYLVRVYLLDGSSKVLQMKESSTAADVLEQLKYNMDLNSIKTFALYRLSNPFHRIQRLELNENIQAAMDFRDGETEIKILFRSWICDENGKFEKLALQEGKREKQSNTALWLKYIEAVFMITSGKYLLTEDEAIMLGCLKLQADSGDFKQSVHTIPMLQTRISTSFPAPIKDKMKTLLRLQTEKNNKKSSSSNNSKAERGEDILIAERVKLLYSRLAGYTKTEAQIEFIRYLRVWCPFYNSTFFSIDCQYDDKPYDSTNQPPVLKVQIAISPLAVFIITQSTPPVIFRLPYKRIVKYVAHTDMNIFMFWILKDSIQFSDILRRLESEGTEEGVLAGGVAGAKEREEEGDEEEGDGEGSRLLRGLGYDPNECCDCIYFVTEQVGEISFLFETYFKMSKFKSLHGHRFVPLLPGDVPDEEDEEEGQGEGQGGGGEGRKGIQRMESFESEMKRKGDQEEEQQQSQGGRGGVMEKRSSRLNLFFQALVGGEEYSSSSSALPPQHLIQEDDLEELAYNDDAAAATAAASLPNNIFTEAYASPAPILTLSSSSSARPPPPPPPRRVSSSVTAAEGTEAETRGGEAGAEYASVDMLLANSLSELSDITQFETNLRPPPQQPPQSSAGDSASGSGDGTRRKSLFGWGK